MSRNSRAAFAVVNEASPWKTLSERDAERQLKHAAVLRVAAQVFAKNGFHESSLDEIAKKLNVTKPTLYRYIKSKDDILYECLLTGVNMLETAIRPLFKSKISGIERLKTIMRVHVNAATQDFGRCLVLVGEDPLPKDTCKKLRTLKRVIDSHMRTAISQGIQDGSIRAIDPKIATFALAGALNWVAHWYDAKGGLSADDLADTLIDTLLYGLAKK